MACRLLTIEQVAERIEMSIDFARDLVKRLGGVRMGTGPRPMWKLRESRLEHWINTGGDEAPWSSTDEDESGGPGDTTGTASAGERAPSSATKPPPARSRRRSSKSSRWTPINPGTKPARSKSRATT